MKATILQERIRAGTARVLDVRTGAEWRSGHIAGAEHLPLDALQRGEMPTTDIGNAELVIVCQSGVRAAKAQLMLQSRGVEAAVLEGGMNAWSAAGLPQEQEEGGHGISLMRQVQLIVGGMNLLGVGLGLSINPWWLVIPVFTGVGLLVAGATGTCGLALILARMPWNR